MAAIKFNFHASFRVLVAMLQTKTFKKNKNIKIAVNEFETSFYEKECNTCILIKLHSLSDTGNQRPIGHNAHLNVQL